MSLVLRVKFVNCSSDCPLLLHLRRRQQSRFRAPVSVTVCARTCTRDSTALTARAYHHNCLSAPPRLPRIERERLVDDDDALCRSSSKHVFSQCIAVAVARLGCACVACGVSCKLRSNKQQLPNYSLASLSHNIVGWGQNRSSSPTSICLQNRQISCTQGIFEANDVTLRIDHH